MSYPPNWPRCPNCGRPALDGHITCGSFECDEHGTRRAREDARMTEQDAFKDGREQGRRDMEGDYLVWSNEHRAWWGPGKHGYARGIKGAGRYSRLEALEICSNGMMTAVHIGMVSEIPVRLADLRAAMAGGIVPAVILDGRQR